MSEWLLLEVKIALPPNCNFQSSWVNKEKPEKEKWKSFRNALDKSDRKKFDEMMFDIPRFYISACFNSVQYVKLHSIPMFKLLYNYRELTECTSEVEQIEAKVERLLLLKKEKGGGEEERQHYCKLKLLL